MNSAKHSLSSKDMTLTALMTAILCILGPVAIPLPFSPVPLSFTNLVLFLMVYILDLRCSLLCYTVYFLLGSVGLPVFSGFSGGLGSIAGPTGGYLAGFFLQVLVSAHVMKHYSGNRFMETLGLILGTVTSYSLGTIWLSGYLHISLTAGLTVGVLPYLLGDGLKILSASLVGPRIRRSLQKTRH